MAENSESAVLRAIAELEALDEPDEVDELVRRQLETGWQRETGVRTARLRIPDDVMAAAAQAAADLIARAAGIPVFDVVATCGLYSTEDVSISAVFRRAAEGAGEPPPEPHAPGILGLVRDALVALARWLR